MTLQNVERMALDDRWCAVDMEGAGRVAKILGAVFAVRASGNRGYVGIGLDLIDAGTSYADLIGLALRTQLGEQYTVEQEVALIDQNNFQRTPKGKTTEP